MWSRLISYHFLNQTTRSNFFSNDTGHGAGQLWSEIPHIPAYQNHLVPFPIVVADSRPVGSNLTTILPLDSVVYEVFNCYSLYPVTDFSLSSKITPLEIASFDPFLSSGMNLSYAGTHLTNGRSLNGSSCTTGFDQASFVMGTSASLFNVSMNIFCLILRQLCIISNSPVLANPRFWYKYSVRIFSQ